MRTERVKFEIDDMHLNVNMDIIQYVYQTSTHHHMSKRQHPLELICDSMKKSYPVHMDTIIKSNRCHAFVIMTFDEEVKDTMINQYAKRFQHTTTQLLNAKVIRIID